MQLELHNIVVGTRGFCIATTIFDLIIQAVFTRLQWEERTPIITIEHKTIQQKCHHTRPSSSKFVKGS